MPRHAAGDTAGMERNVRIRNGDSDAATAYAHVNTRSASYGHGLAFGHTEGLSPLLGYVSYSEGGMGNWTDVALSSFNGIIHVDGNANVSSIVDREVTIASSGSISVVGDLIHHDGDGIEPAPGCDDIIRLAATDRVIVADTAPKRSDCVTHAHVAAVNNQGCIVENYNLGSPRGTLSLHGGVAQDKWSPVALGYVMNGGLIILTGYRRDFHYDHLLMEMMPPGHEFILDRAGTHYRIASRDLADGQRASPGAGGCAPASPFREHVP